MPVALSAPHWLPVRRMKKIPSRAARSGTRGLWQPSGWLGRGGSSAAIRSHKASGIRQPLSWIISPIALLHCHVVFKQQQSGRQILPTGIGSKRHDGRVVKRVFEPVRIEQVELDDAVAEFGEGRNIDLDLASKFSIAPGFIRDLMDVGLEQARRTSAKLITEKKEVGSA